MKQKETSKLFFQLLATLLTILTLPTIVTYFFIRIDSNKNNTKNNTTNR